MPSLQEEFGVQVKHHRKRRGLTQQELAERAKLSLEMIGRIERGTAAPSLESIEVLSDVLGVPARDLFGAGPYAAGKRSGKLGAIVAKLAVLKPDDLQWIDELLNVATKRLGK